MFAIVAMSLVYQLWKSLFSLLYIDIIYNKCFRAFCLLSQDILFSIAPQTETLTMMSRELSHLLVSPSPCWWRPQMVLIPCLVAQLRFWNQMSKLCWISMGMLLFGISVHKMIYNPNTCCVFNKFRDAFEKEMEGLPSTTRSVGELPPELKCPLCKEVMRDAALTSKCCYESFCDKCKFF